MIKWVLCLWVGLSFSLLASEKMGPELPSIGINDPFGESQVEFRNLASEERCGDYESCSENENKETLANAQECCVWEKGKAKCSEKDYQGALKGALSKAKAASESMAQCKSAQRCQRCNAQFTTPGYEASLLSCEQDIKVVKPFKSSAIPVVQHFAPKRTTCVSVTGGAEVQCRELAEVQPCRRRDP